MTQATVRIDPSQIGDYDERVVNVLDQYLIDCEQGTRPDIESIIACNRDIEQPLRESFEALKLLRSMDTDLPQLPTALVSPVQNRLDDFELGEELGRGAAGIVYAARQVSLDQPVAVKVLAFCSALNSDRVERFYREATAAALLNHPHIVSVIGVGCCDRTHYYAMNRVNGASLDRRLDAIHTNDSAALAAPLVGEDRFQRIALFMADAADAIAHAHDAGIIHRDIKPSNLLLTDSGHVWVADFGLARIGREGDLTRSGELVGTLRYMSPEQASGRNELVDARTDIYALGATLYELVLLRPTFTDSDSASLLKAIQTSEPPTPRTLDRHVPKPLEIIIRRALRRTPSERYASAGEFAADLRRFAKGEPILASRVTLTERWVGFARDHAAAVAASFVLAIVTLAASLTHNVIVSRLQTETNRALKLSESDFKQARRAVDTLGADVARRLASIPGTTELRHDVLAETLGYYESFIADANEDPRLIVDVAKTRLKIAQLICASGSAFAESNTAYEASVKSLRAVEQQQPSDETRKLSLQALSEWAMLRSEQGDDAGATKLLDEALLNAAMIDDASARDLATALVRNNRGAILLHGNDRESALKEMRAAVALFESASLSMDAQDDALTSDLAVAMANLGTLMSQAGYKDEAARLLTQSISISERYSSGLGGTGSELRRRALAHNNLAALRWRAGEANEAIESYGRAVTLLEQAVTRLPGLAGVRRELAVALNNQGMALSSAKRFDEAEKTFRRAIAIAKPAADADPQDVAAARECGGILNNLGVLLRDCGRSQDAKMVLAEAIEQQLRADQLSPNDPENHRFLDQIRQNYVSVDG